MKIFQYENLNTLQASVYEIYFEGRSVIIHRKCQMEHTGDNISELLDLIHFVRSACELDI